MLKIERLIYECQAFRKMSHKAGYGGVVNVITTYTFLGKCRNHEIIMLMNMQKIWFLSPSVFSPPLFPSTTFFGVMKRSLTVDRNSM